MSLTAPRCAECRLRATFVDIALLAGGVDFVHMGKIRGKASNYAAWAEGWSSLGKGSSFHFPRRA